MIFISVDLPAPFSPISACTVTRRSLNFTLSRATTPGNFFRTPKTSSSNSSVRAAGLGVSVSTVSAMDMVPLWWPPGAASAPLHQGQDGRGQYEVSTRSVPGWYELSTRLILGAVLGQVRRGHQFERNPDHRFGLLALGQRERGVDGDLALLRGVLEHRDLQVASLHCGEPVLGSIDAGHDRALVHLLRGLQRLDRADRHLVVVGDDSVELHT